MIGEGGAKGEQGVRGKRGERERARGEKVR